MLNNGNAAVKVYTYDGSSWQQKGNMITMHSPSSVFPHRFLQIQDTIGIHISMTSDGNALTVLTQDGSVRAFRYSTIDGSWELTDSVSPATSIPGRDISLSRNGTILATCVGGEDGAAFVYRRTETGTYTQEHTIYADCDSVSVSMDGGTVAVGSNYTTFVIKNDGGSWVSKGDALSGAPQTTVKLSANGETMATSQNGKAHIFTFGVPIL